MATHDYIQIQASPKEGEGRADFGPGQIVRHQLFGYRGVVFDVDAVFMGTEDWYLKVAKSRPPKDKPWYHVLPDGSDQTTYVAEQNLRPAEVLSPIQHPLVESHFDRFENGEYRSVHSPH
ncbi:MAG: heat shock protein HspQ [Acidobacteriota bacterium]